MNLRQHQQDMLAVCARILAGAPIRTILCGVTPGGGKSLLPQILAAKLIPTIADKLCWIVPRKALQDQGARGFADPHHRALLGHTLEAMTSTNQTNPTKGCAAYVTTYQALAADKSRVNAKEFSKRRYLLVLDEPHHVEEGGLWHEAVQPLVEQAIVVCLMSGTFERGDGDPIAFIDYDEQPDGFAIDWRETDTRAVIRYSLRQAWQERAVIDLEVHYVDCSATWKDRLDRVHVVPSLHRANEKDLAPALYTALHSEAAIQLLAMGVEGWQATKRTNPRAKLLVVAATIDQAKRYTEWFIDQGLMARIATSDDSESAHQAIKAFKQHGRSGLDILITVAMAYEGLDVPAITHLICLTHIRTKPWIEQVVHRATRVDYAAGPYETQQAHIYAPDDALFRSCMDFILAERDRFRACAPTAMPEEAQPGNPMMQDLFGGQGLYPGLEIIGSSVVGVRQDPLLQHIKHMMQPSFDELPTPTPAERIQQLRTSIESRCRGYERKKNLHHGTVNREIYQKFRKSRAAMTEQELQKVLDWVGKQYA